MKRNRKRILAALVAACMIFGDVVPTYAAEISESVMEEENTVESVMSVEETEVTVEPEVQQIETITEFYINPLYEDVITEEDLVSPPEVATISDDVQYYDSIEDAAAVMRENLVKRTETFEVGYQYVGEYTSDYVTQLSHDISDVAFAHTGNPEEGDYLAWQFGGWSVAISGYMGSKVSLTFTYTLTYYTTAEQESEMNTAVNSLLTELSLDNASDYEKVKGIYDWLCDNVTYDYDNLNDDTYKLKHTAYAALINRTSVCQGYAVLFYRLALEEGIDARVITGYAGEAHAWNIVELDNLYYNLDATWDAPRNEYKYFLQNAEGFSDHIREEKYLTEEFEAEYPMSVNVYDPEAERETFTYEVLENGTIAITGYTGEESSELVIPEKIDGYDVTVIEKFAFLDCTDLKKVYLPDSVTEIDNLAFVMQEEENTYSTLAVTYHASKDSYAYSWAKENGFKVLDPEDGPYALEYEVLEDGTACITGYVGELPGELTIPEKIDGYTVTVIGESAFAEELKLTSVVLPETITTIEFCAFANCTNLKEINIPKNVTFIGNAAFRYCSSLTDVELPEGITYVGTFAFWNCTGLTEINIPESLTKIEWGAFYQCTNLKKVTISEKTTNIDSNAFRECSSLESIVIPDSVTEIGDYAFDCTTIVCYKDSYAYSWAVANEVDVHALGYSIQFNSNGASEGEMSNQQCYYRVDNTLYENVFAKEGYTFNGWNTASDGSGISYNDLATHSVNSGMDGEVFTLYAQWLVDTYGIKYIANGGTIEEDAVTEFTIESETTGLPTAVKKGYIFEGWYENKDFTGTAVTEIETGSIGNKVFYAKWTPIEYEIKYEANGGTIAEDAVKNYTVESATLVLSTATKNGYTFKGWYETKDFTGVAVTEVVAGSTGNKVLYAKWIPTGYEIKYEVNGGTIIEDAATEYTIESAAVKLPTATKNGYAFEGWYETEDFTGTAVTEIETGSTGNRTFYAKWNFNTKFTVVPADKEIIIPYESNGWAAVTTHVSLWSDPEGFTIDNSKAEIIVKDPNGNSVDVTDFNFEVTVPGTYTVNAKYRCGDGEADIAIAAPAEINVVYGKRTYPIEQEIEWSGISNLDTGLKFSGIIEDIFRELNDDIENKLNIDIGETVHNGTITIKNSKGKYVWDEKTNAAVSSGTYQIIYTLSGYNAETEERFYETAESKLTITYSSFSLDDFEYSLSKEAQPGTIAGAVIAAPIVDENGTPINSSAYDTTAVITPVFSSSDGKLTAEELREKGYEVSISAEEEGKSRILSISEEKDGTFSVKFDTESDSVKLPATRNLKVTAIIQKDDKSVTLTKTIKNFKVVSGGTEIVHNIQIDLLDSEGKIIKPDSESEDKAVYLMHAEDMTSVAISYPLNVQVMNFAGDDYEGRLKEANLKWTTNNKSLAEVKVDRKTGEATLNIKKGAVGTVDITVTANDAYKKSVTFKLFILDTDVRVDSTKLTMNSRLEESGILKIYPNVAALEAASSVREGDTGEWYVKFSVLEDEGIFEIEPEGYQYDSETGELPIQFLDAEQADKTYTLKLLVEQYIGNENESELFASEELTFKITNKKSWPKLTLKATSSYNTAYLTEAGYAELLITSAVPVAAETITGTNNPKIYIDSEEFCVESITRVQSTDNQWSMKLSMDDAPDLKANKSKRYTVGVSVQFEGYRTELETSVKMTAINKAPVVNVYGNEVYKPTLYPQLAFEETKVLIELPEGITNASVSLTNAASKHFEIVESESVTDGTAIDKNGNAITVGNAVCVTVRSTSGKSANVQFIIKNAFANAVTTKSLKVAVEKVTSLAMSMLNLQTGKKTTSVTFQKSAAGKELLTLVPQIPNEIIKIYEMNGLNPSEYLELRVEGIDNNTKAMIDGAALVIEQNDDGNVEIKTTGKLFEDKKISSCKVKFTVYAINGEEEIALKSSSLTIKLQKSDTVLSVSGSVKGKMNAVAPEGSVTVVPTFKNLPYGAQVIGVEFSNNVDKELYKINEGLSLIRENDGVLTISKASNDTILPIGKSKVGLTYKVQLMGGTTLTANTTVTINVTQNASISANEKTVTLYNSVTGESYAKELVFKETKAGAVIKSVEFSGLENSGITVVQSAGENGERSVKFYVDNAKDRGLKKTYTVKATVSLEGSGTKKGKEVTYTVNLKVVLNN